MCVDVIPGAIHNPIQNLLGRCALQRGDIAHARYVEDPACHLVRGILRSIVMVIDQTSQQATKQKETQQTKHHLLHDVALSPLEDTQKLLVLAEMGQNATLNLHGAEKVRGD